MLSLSPAVFWSALLFFLGSGALEHSRAQSGTTPGKLTFNESIRPILSDRCFYCHGPDEKHREAHLRLDTLEGALSDLGGYSAVVPGHPEKSELIARITTHDKEDLMPPAKSAKPRLEAAAVAVFTRWISEGAEYQSHWSFLPLSKAPAPTPGAAAWPRNPIDTFILARLESAKIAPSPEADRATLIRRVSLDLTGLLPSPEEVNAFLVDARPDAYERLVDKLLADPHYGERWGRHWLDGARYADSNGYSVDGDRAMWPYRDWVIKALNDDLPFDEFTREQLAGDLLPHPTKNQLIATAFHRNTLINEEGGVKPEQFRVEAAIDRVNTTGAVWLGLTVGCAQCHTHKFDPITQREFYQMFAFFNQGEDVNNRGTTLEVVRGEVFGNPAVEAPVKVEPVKALEQTTWEAGELARLRAFIPSGESKAPAAVWTPAKYVEYDTSSGAGFQLLADNSLLADGGGAFNDTYRVVATSALAEIAAVRLRVLTHDSLPNGGPGMAGNGNFVLTGFDVKVAGEEQPIASAWADHEQAQYPVGAAIDENGRTGWAINVAKGSAVKMNAAHEAVFTFAKPIVLAAGQSIEVRLHHDLNERYLVGRFALEFSQNPAGTKSAATLSEAEAGLLEALKTAASVRTDEETRRIRDAFERARPTAAGAKPRPARREIDATADIAEVMVMKEVAKPRPTFLFQRGDFLRPDEKLGPLEPGVIAAVNAAFEKPAGKFKNRLDLANWLVDPQNPLTPRVTMNRVWMRYFGRGLVETEEDFGAQGSAPTHPELLDWLGREFIARGWSMKAMHRLIVTSATYRQSSKARPDLIEKDPRNLLLARQERVRVEAEIIRDAALSASGLLDGRIGGPGVHPPQPEGVYSFTQTQRKWKPSAGGDRFRRALYTVFYRSAPYPLFTTFDSPDFQSVCTRRARSNTPLQSLTLANDEAFFEMAQGLAARVVREVPGAEHSLERLRRALFLALCRPPSEKETAILNGYFAQQIGLLKPDEAAALLSPELAKSDTPPVQAAALVSVARAILNTDAFITRE